MQTAKWQRWSWVAPLIATLLILIWGTLLDPTRVYDDAYITYRYADNLRSGQGLLYNPGEWVLGTTAPLFALLLAFLGLLVSDLALLGLWLGVFGWIGTVWGAWGLLQREQRTIAAVATPLLLAAHPDIALVLGMETTVVTAFMLLSGWLWLRHAGERLPWLAMVLMAAAVLTRADSALWLAAVGLAVWRRTGRLPWREGVMTTLLTLPWFAYAYWRYGSPLPNSATAKFGQTDLMPVDPNAPATQFLLDFRQAVGLDDWWWLGLLIFALLIFSVTRWNERFGWLVGWLGAYLVFYTLYGVVSFPWYFVPPLVVTMLLLGLAIETLTDRRPILAPLLLAALLTPHAVALAEVLRDPPSRYLRAYADAGRWLAENSPPDARVAAIEIGALGYFSERPILDTMGLISPVMTERQFGWAETLVVATNSLQPEYALTLTDTAWDWVVAQPWFVQQYEPVATFGKVTIYERQLPEALAAVFRPNYSYQAGIILNRLSLSSRTLDTPTLDLRVDLSAAQPQTADHELVVALVDSQTFETVAFQNIQPFDGRYRTSLWQPDDRFELLASLDIPPDLPTGAYQIGVTYAAETAFAGWLLAGGSSSCATQPLTETWDDLALVGGNWSVDPDGLTLCLAWQAATPIAADWRLFVHLVDGTGNIVAQHDGRPGNFRFPTPSWPIDTTVYDDLRLPIADLPSGDYRLRVGFYNESGRLLREDGSDSWLISTVTLP